MVAQLKDRKSIYKIIDPGTETVQNSTCNRFKIRIMQRSNIFINLYMQNHTKCKQDKATGTWPKKLKYIYK
jgi:hypothetical protein